ncbi:aldose 1-epimerase [Cellulosimicrobium sp. PMB13]|uniref:aldose 1-epimerase n=1 Tax=Cellulosimicrobium sp. PMB13 TaxID=3120158 RepID=UPI003F4AF7E0
MADDARSWSRDVGGVPVERVEHPSGARLVVALHGAAVLSWRAPWRHADGSVVAEELVDGYADAGELAAHDASRSAVMAPFVNRVAGGRYTFDGRTHHIPPVVPGEPVTMHGFARALDWHVSRRAEAAGPDGVASLVLRAEVGPELVRGYPYAVAFEAEYGLGAAGLDLTLRATNIGGGPAPVALGWHPYLRVPGHASIDALELTVPAARRVVTGEDLIPLPGGAAYAAIDAVGPMPLAGVRLDHAFADLRADVDGRARTIVRDPRTGLGLALWQRGGLVHVYTGDGLARRERAAIAVEPVSTLTNAFNRTDCEPDVRLAPGATRRLEAGVELLGQRLGGLAGEPG